MVKYDLVSGQRMETTEKVCAAPRGPPITDKKGFATLHGRTITIPYHEKVVLNSSDQPTRKLFESREGPSQ